jgi:2',3'-cyclic-nucleotide 2'-phosphodiesterase (5'-nucleotidase family)
MIISRRFASLVLGLVIFALPAGAATTRITFIAVNDIYQMSAQTGADGKSRGGFAKLAAVVKAERAKGGHVLFTHAGDMLSPSLMSSFDKGAHMIALANMTPPDIFVPGNHEYDFGKAVFLQRMREAKFPVYAANLRGPDGQPLAGIKDRSMLTVDGIRIGLTGATADGSPAQSSPEDLQFWPTVETVKQQSAALRREGADFVVAVVHANRHQDSEIFDSRAADLILSGDDHDLLLNFDGQTAMVESSFDAHYLTAIDVTIKTDDSSGRRQVTWWPQFRVIDTANIRPDPVVAAKVRELERRLSKELDAPVGTTTVVLDSRTPTMRTREASIGNLFADALRASTSANAVVINGGGIRGGKTYPPGTKLTRRDILAELPFTNHVVLIEITGKELKAALENGLSLLPAAAGRFPQVSGLSLVADLKLPAGQRIETIKVGDAALDENKIYKIATNDFMAQGGDGYAAFRAARQLNRDYDGPLVTNEVMAYLRKLGTVSARIEGRVILK